MTGPPPPSRILPEEPIDRLTAPLQRLFHIEAASGIILLGVTVLALGLANSPWAEAFLGFWQIKAGFVFGGFEFRHSLKHLINDGLMVLFFFVVGLEVKREMVTGELQQMRSALLPIAAAVVGGMIVPALIYLALQPGGASSRGWGIPMATDIAFVVGCLALLGPRVPHGLRVLLLSLAIIDDIGAILVIAFGYSSGIHWIWLGSGLGGLALVAVLARMGVRNFLAYLILGFSVWFAFHESGVHATVAGVLLGLLTPARSYLTAEKSVSALESASHLGPAAVGVEQARLLQRVVREGVSPVNYLIHVLHPWVAFGIMPLFAFANAGVPLRGTEITSPLSLAVILGLLIGKPVGVLLFSWVPVRLGWTRLPAGVSWFIMLGAACLAGIGFTMALFIASLALQGQLLDTAKVGVLAGSLLSGVAGLALLYRALPSRGVA